MERGQREAVSMRVLAWGLTHPGQKREHNEDAFLINAELGLFMVADGMGGHFGGDRASRLAVELLEHELDLSGMEEPTAASSPGASGDVQSAAGRTLREAARRTSRAIYNLGESDPELQGMGTTMTALWLKDGRAHLAHVGDSRCYLYRDGDVRQLTQDHSWTEEQVRAGFMTPDEAQNSALKHVITRSVGFEPDVDVDIASTATEMGDCFILCSDGLYNYVNARQLRDYLVRGYYSEVPRRLVETANSLGGEDNITVLVICVANESREHLPALYGG
jgi:serine/threonine protein phosphatase PrpC